MNRGYDAAPAMTGNPLEPAVATAELQLRPWHRWRAVIDTWMGLPVPPDHARAASLHLTERAARNRLTESERFGLHGHVERITR